MSDQIPTTHELPESMSSPAAATATDVAGGSTSSIWDKLEKLIKAGTIVLALVAAMGFPAVYIQFYRFGIPATFITYDQILKAGMLPTALLIALGAYVYWAAQEWRLGKSVFRSFLLIFILMAPLIVVVLLMVVLGIISLVLLLILLVLRAINWAAGYWLHTSASPAATTRIALSFLLGLLILYAIAQFAKPKWWEKQGRGWNLLRRLLRNVPRNPLDIDRFLIEIHVFEPEYSMRSMISTLTFLLATMYGLKLTTYLLDPRISSIFAHKYLLTLGVGCAVVFFGSSYLFDYVQKVTTDQDPPGKRKAYLAASCILATVYLAAVVGYSYGLYSRLPQGLGGGKPAAVTLWVVSDQAPINLRQNICAASSSDSAKVVRCDGAFLVYSNSEYLLITSRPAPPAAGTVFQKSSIAAISW